MAEDKTELAVTPAAAAAESAVVVEMFPFRVQHAAFLWPTTTIYLPELPSVGEVITVNNDRYQITNIMGRPVFEPGNPVPIGLIYTLIVIGPVTEEL